MQKIALPLLASLEESCCNNCGTISLHVAYRCGKMENGREVKLQNSANPRPPSYKPQETGHTRPLVSPQEVAQAVQEEDLHLNCQCLGRLPFVPALTVC